MTHRKKKQKVSKNMDCFQFQFVYICFVSEPMRKESKQEKKIDSKQKPNEEFNIDDIIHMDVIPGKQIVNQHSKQSSKQIFTSGLANILDEDPMLETIEPSSAKSGESGGSRFSQFFSKPRGETAAPGSGAGQLSARAKLDQNNDELGTNEFTSIKIPSPGDPSAYFAPISPAAKTENPSNPIMDLLRSSGKSKL